MLCIPSCCSAYRIILLVNGLICFFGIFAIGVASYSIYYYSEAEDNFFSQESYAFLLLGGLLTFFVTCLAIVGARDPKKKPNYLFCYWCIMSLIIIFNCAGFYYFRLFIRNIDDASTGQVSSVVRATLAKEFQDYLLSTYTSCCTGCKDEVGLECVFEINGTANCPTVAVSGVADCLYALKCPPDSPNQGLGEGCYTAASEIPPYEISQDTCNVLTELENDGKPLVGPASNGHSCGGGDPKEYIKEVNEYFNSVYYLVAVPWGFSILLEIFAWLAAVYLIMCPYSPEGKD